MLRIVFGDHARDKLTVLREHGLVINEEIVREAVVHPDKIVPGSHGRSIAQRILDSKHVLRVVFIQEGETVRIVTLYPARRNRYIENQV